MPNAIKPKPIFKTLLLKENSWEISVSHSFALKIGPEKTVGKNPIKAKSLRKSQEEWMCKFYFCDGIFSKANK